MPCHMWRWVSTKPGITIMREASMTSALGALMLACTAEILPPSISTSACSKSPTARSRVSTQPPLIRIARPEAVAPLACCARTGPPLAPITLEAATAVAAVVQRNWRRESAGDELHALQKQDQLASDLGTCVMESSQLCSGVSRDATAVQGALLASTAVGGRGSLPANARAIHGGLRVAGLRVKGRGAGTAMRVAGNATRRSTYVYCGVMPASLRILP